MLATARETNVAAAYRSFYPLLFRLRLGMELGNFLQHGVTVCYQECRLVVVQTVLHALAEEAGPYIMISEHSENLHFISPIRRFKDTCGVTGWAGRNFERRVKPADPPFCHARGRVAHPGKFLRPF
jgi:hypothetical protein